MALFFGSSTKGKGSKKDSNEQKAGFSLTYVTGGSGGSDDLLIIDLKRSTALRWLFDRVISFKFR